MPEEDSQLATSDRRLLWQGDHLIPPSWFLHNPCYFLIMDQDQDYIEGQRVIGKSMNFTLKYQIKIFRYDLN